MTPLLSTRISRLPHIFFLCHFLLSAVTVRGSWWNKNSRKSSINAFFYYQNAKCIDDYHIQGTAVLSFDDDTMNAKYGHVIQNFAGPCRYFKGGSIDVYKSNLFGSSVNDVYQKGYCTENCSQAGHVGCSVNGSCSTFMNFARKRTTTVKKNVTDATTEEEASSYQMSLSSSASDNYADNLQRSFTNVMLGSRSSSSYDEIGYYLLGGCISLIGLVSLVAILEKLRQQRVAREAPLLNDSSRIVPNWPVL